MLNVQSLSNFINGIGPQKNVYRYCLYNYLQNFAADTEPVDDELFEAFFQRAYTFRHWRENQKELLSHLNDLIHRYFRNMHSLAPIKLDENFNWQFIELQSIDDFKLAVESMHSENENIERAKVVSLNLEECLTLYVLKGGNIEITVHRNAFYISKGKLKALTPVTHLKYNENLDLLPNEQQILSLNPSMQVHLYFSPSLAGLGHMIRGYSFQNHSTVEFKHLRDYPDMHQKVKRLEHHFIHPNSDPEYVDLILLIEKSTQMIIQREPGSEKIALSTYQKAQYAFENLFPNDKYLKLLLSQLELAIFKCGRETMGI